MPRGLIVERLLVDGYNVLHSDARYTTIAEADLDAARARLVEDVASHAVGRYRATVVFDGGANPASTGEPHRIAGVTVVFSAAGWTADELIERLAHRWRERGERVTVVTSDALTQHTVGAGDVAVLSSRAFVSSLAEDREQTSARATRRRVRVTLESRVDPAVREVLARWARGT